MRLPGTSFKTGNYTLRRYDTRFIGSDDSSHVLSSSIVIQN